MEFGNPRYLLGVTLFAQRPGVFKKRPDTKAGWKVFEEKATSRSSWKLDLETGEIIGQKSLGATLKLLVPRPWLFVKKWMRPPGYIGSTKKHWGFMIRVGWGEVEHLSRKLDMIELYFPPGKGKPFRGRYFLRAFDPKFRFVAAKEFEKETAEVAGFLFIKPKDQTPYVLSSRAVKKGFIPPFGRHALPKELARRIPSRLRYWTRKNERERCEVRDTLVNELRKKRFMRFLFSGLWHKIALD